MQPLRLRWPRALPRLSLPGLCAICRGWSGERICPACCARHAAPVPRCRRCALEVPAGVDICGHCLRRPPAFDAALAAVDYAHPWDALVARLKFRDALDLAPAFASLLWQAAAVAPGRPELLLPVPLGGQRLRRRGYNQSWEIARHLARRSGAACDARLLLRIRETPPQLGLALDQRASNVRGAFAVEPTRRAELSGRFVVLVDDVMTTGETAGELALTLKAAGAARVEVWVVARTPPPADAPPRDGPAAGDSQPSQLRTISRGSTSRMRGSM